jgi:hypothetical protein
VAVVSLRGSVAVVSLRGSVAVVSLRGSVAMTLKPTPGLEFLTTGWTLVPAVCVAYVAFWAKVLYLGNLVFDGVFVRTWLDQNLKLVLGDGCEYNVNVLVLGDYFFSVREVLVGTALVFGLILPHVEDAIAVFD